MFINTIEEKRVYRRPEERFKLLINEIFLVDPYIFDSLNSFKVVQSCCYWFCEN